MKKSKFQFVRPYLSKLVFNENDQFNIETDISKVIDVHNAFSIRIDKDIEKPMARVTLNLKMNKNSLNAPFKIDASISSFFHWHSLEEEQVERMLSINAPAVLLSYLRPIISQVTNFSQFPTYDIPFVNFADGQIHIQKNNGNIIENDE